jgi:biotin synthase
MELSKKVEEPPINRLSHLLKIIVQENYLPEANEIVELLNTGQLHETIISYATKVKQRHFGDEIHIRGIIEFSNYCVKQCKYCGIRSNNSKIVRYRMEDEEIITRIKLLHQLGYPTVVLQGGEDPMFSTSRLVNLIKTIKKSVDIVITLSIGERTQEEYVELRKAGAQRFLLRFETCSQELYAKYHPHSSFKKREEALLRIRKAGFQTGTGFLMGLPGSTVEDLARNILYTSKFKPDMIGTGPYIPPEGLTSLSPSGDRNLFFITIALLRLLNPLAHIPATTAFDTFDMRGREKLLKTSCNVFMPNLTPCKYRKLYTLYPSKSRVDKDQWHFLKVDTTLSSLGLTKATGPGDSILPESQNLIQDKGETNE